MEVFAALRGGGGCSQPAWCRSREHQTGLSGSGHAEAVKLPVLSKVTVEFLGVQHLGHRELKQG